MLNGTFFNTRTFVSMSIVASLQQYINSVANLYKTIDRIARSNVCSAKNTLPIELGTNKISNGEIIDFDRGK